MFGFGSKPNKPADNPAPADPYLIGKTGYGAPLHYSFGYRAPPESGAANYAFETLCLPRYNRSGPSMGNRDGWNYHTDVVGVIQGAIPFAIGSPGLQTGGFYAGPLTDNQPSNIGPAQLAALHMSQSFMLPGKGAL